MHKFLVSSILLLFFSSQATAGIAKESRVFCKVGDFSEKSVDLKCHPKSNAYLKIPRGWLDQDTKLVRDTVIAMSVDQVKLDSINRQHYKLNYEKRGNKKGMVK